MPECIEDSWPLSPLCHICHSGSFCNFIPLLFVDHLPTMAHKEPIVRVTRTLSFPLHFCRGPGGYNENSNSWET